MKCNFIVGQKVVCINDQDVPDGIILKNSRYDPSLHGLRQGAVYLIRAVEYDIFESFYVVLLKEITRPQCPFTKREAGYDARRFRPLVERKTDISIFTTMLTGKQLEVAHD